MSDFMRDSDAFAWYMENDPTLRSTVVAVAWLDGAPEWDVLAAKVDRATRLIPNFRRRVCEPPFRLATPRWTAADTIDLTRHLHRVDAPVGHGSSTVMAIAHAAATEGFDRSRPLWDFTLVEHLEGGRAALVMKLHHSLTDGVGGIQLAMLLFDLEASPAPPVSEPEGNGDVAGARAEDLILLSLARGGERVVDLVSHARGVRPPDDITRCSSSDGQC